MWVSADTTPHCKGVFSGGTLLNASPTRRKTKGNARPAPPPKTPVKQAIMTKMLILNIFDKNY